MAITRLVRVVPLSVKGIIMNPIHNALKNMGAEFRVYDTATSHPDALTHLSEDELSERIADIYNARNIELMELSSTKGLLTGRGGHLYIGYDTEWREENRHLRTLSYQFYAVGELGEVSAVFFPPSGRHIDRLALKEMLPAVIEKARETGCIIDYPEQVILIGFFLRADLAMLSDLVEYKTELGNVGGKIATTERPVDFDVLYRRIDVQTLTSNTEVICG